MLQDGSQAEHEDSILFSDDDDDDDDDEAEESHCREMAESSEESAQSR